MKRDETLIDEIVSKGKLFFLNCILPELLAKRYSSVKSVPASRDINQSAVPFHSANLNQYICYCQDPAREGETIMCCSDMCVIHEFHKSCTRSKVFRNWICIYCNKKIASQRRKVAAEQKRKDASCNANEILEDVTVNKELISISTQPTSSGHIVGNTCKLLLKYL